ncbi:MAG: response regulator [Xanthomonadales bacterium]|nr:response regulator [Xanthomonadales bacterium]
MVVLIEPDSSVRDALTLLLEGERWGVREVNGCEGLAEALENYKLLAVISESNLPGCTPEEILEQCNRHHLPVIFTGNDLSLQEAVDLIRQGAVDFLDKPFSQSRLVNLLDQLGKDRGEVISTQ